MEDHEQALAISQEAMQLAIQFDDVFWQGNCHAMLIDDYLALDQVDSAQYHLARYRAIAEGDDHRMNLANSYAGDVWLAANKPREALIHIDKALSSFKARNNTLRTQEVLLKKSRAHMALAQREEALVYATEAYELAVAEEYNPSIQYTLELLVEIYTALGDYPNALAYQQRYQAHFEQVYNASKASSLSSMEAEQMQEIEAQKRLLSEQEAALKAEVITRQRSVIIGIVLLLTLLVVIVYLWYRGQQQKQQLTETQLIAQEERANRIAEELR